MTDDRYANREIDAKHEEVLEKIDGLQNVLELRMTTFEKDARNSLTRIEYQTTAHNHRMTKIERYLIILGTVVATIILLKFPQVASLLRLTI